MNLTATQLTKLTYMDINYTEPAVRRWQALLNPTELSFSRKNHYRATQPAGTPAPQQSFSGSEPEQLQIDLLLDGTGVVGDPGGIGSHLDALLALTKYHGDQHQPYYVKLSWKPFIFRGVVTEADVTYKLFDRTGEPLRATVKLTIKEALSPEEMDAKYRDSSPDLYQTWLVRDGEALDAIAAQVYGDPAFWRPLASANRLANPRGLVTGQLLMLPPLEKAS